jgi:NitT/TauT family transport system permease protein
LFVDGSFLTDVLASVARVLTAFVLCAVSAIPVGVLMGRVKIVEAVLSPFVVFMRYAPVSAFIPLLILWTGIGDLQKVIFLWLGTFFYLVALIAGNTASVPSHLLETGYTLGANQRQVLWRIVLPAALPNITDSLRVMMAVGWTYIVLAEIVAAQSGIGHMIMDSQRFLKTSRVIVGIITVGLIGIGLDYLFQLVRRLLVPWTHPHEEKLLGGNR